MRKMIYLDNAATTPVSKEVVLAMKPFWSEVFGNPGSITKIGVKAKQAVEGSRKIIAECLKARPQEIIFTSGGTESNNLAIFGVVNNLEKKGMKISDMHFIISNIEHSSVTECFKELERRGAKLDYLKVNESGLIEPKDLRKLIKDNTVLVSVGYANSEIGVIQPIKEIAKEIRHTRKIHQGGTLILFHTDASQAGLYLNLNVQELGVDIMTLDAQKINGPKGVGILFKKSTVEISPIIFGGGQESGLRSGTENVPLVVGIAKALEICRSGHPSLDKVSFGKGPKTQDFEYSVLGKREVYRSCRDAKGAVEKIRKVRDYFWQKVQKEIPEALLNGDLENRLPNNLNISISGIDSEFTVFCLDEAGIACSTKSACSHEDDGSAVVRSLGKSEDIVKSTLRFSLGENITKKDIDYVVKNLKEITKNQKLASL